MVELQKREHTIYRGAVNSRPAVTHARLSHMQMPAWSNG